jgi:CRP-like cAMP-binding protein
MRGTSEILPKTHWLFGGLTQNERSGISKALHTKPYAAGEVIFLQGDQPDRLYLIISGEVSVEVISAGGHTTQLARLSAPEIFGEFALIDGKPRSASASAVTDCNLASLDKARFLRLIEHSPGFALRLASGLVSRLRNSNAQIESLNTQPLKARLLNAILSVEGSRNGTVILTTQTQLAEHVSGSREKVNKNLKAIERDGLITVRRGQIEIRDVTGLRKMLAACG